MTERGHSSRHEPSDSVLALISPEFVAMLWRRKWHLALPVAIALALGFAYLLRVHPMYQVQARVLVEKQGMPLEQERPSPRNDAFLATQAEIIRSPAVVARAAASLPASVIATDGLDPAVMILDSLTVKPVLGTNVLGVGFVGPDETRGIQTVEAIIASYREYLRKSDHQSHLESAGLLTREERDLRGDLNEQQRQYLQLRQNSALLGQGTDAAAVQRALLTRLGQQVTDARSRRMELGNRMHAAGSSGGLVTSTASGRASLYSISLAYPQPAQAAADASAPEDAAGADLSASARGSQAAAAPWQIGGTDTGVDVAGLDLIRRELFRAEAEQRSLAQQFGPKHPEMRAAAEKAASWQRRVDEAIDAVPVLLQQELDTAVLQEQQLSRLYQTEFEKAKTIDLQLVQEQQALDGIQRVQTVYDSILTQLRQWQLADQALAEGRTGVKVSTLEAPTLAERVVFPPPMLLLAVCTIVGLIGGASLVTVLEHTDTRVQSAEQLQQRLNRSIVGRIPSIDAPKGGVPKPLYRSRMARHYPESPAAEAFRALRTRLALDSEAERGRVIQLTSAHDGEGKTTIAANLAISFSQLGKKVLLIDADLRRGTLHDVFDVTNSSGLTSVLEDHVSLQHAVRRSPLAKVDLLTRGPDVSNPAELLAQPKLAEILQAARQTYDLVLVDTSPLLTVTEPSVIASKVDSVLLSTMIGRSSLVDAQRACELLDTLDARTEGIVVSQVPSNKRNGSYSYYATQADAAAASQA